MSLVSKLTSFIFPFHKSTPRSSTKPLTACLYRPFKRYSQERSKEQDMSISRYHLLEHERAPSTAEEFKRVAEEKLSAADQGVASETSDKVCDGLEEATIGDGKVESMKNKFKEHEEGADYTRKGNDD